MATIKDVARLVGVSPITVSRVLNEPDTVKEATRVRVLAAMQELKYIPNTAAKNLVTKRSGVVDVYIPENIDLSNPFVMHFIAGISQVLSEQMYSFLILRNRKREHLCDGYIVTGLLRDEIGEFVDYASERNRPVVLFGHTDLPEVDCIDVDNVLGSKMGVEHLLSLGHRDIAMINVQENKDYSDDRLNGYRAALLEHGIPFRDDMVVYAPNSVEGGVQAVQQLLARGNFSAIFCATDTMGIGVSNELERLGKSIPDDISLVGFDGFGHHLMVKPRLTSVQQPIYAMGVMLAETLLRRLDGNSQRVKKLIPPTFIPGDSTARPHI